MRLGTKPIALFLIHAFLRKRALLPLLHVISISTILTGLGPTAAFQKNITWHRKGMLKSHIGPKLMARQLTIELAATTAHSVTTTHKPNSTQKETINHEAISHQEIDPPEFSDDVLSDYVFTQKKYQKRSKMQPSYLLQFTRKSSIQKVPRHS